MYAYIDPQNHPNVGIELDHWTTPGWLWFCATGTSHLVEDHGVSAHPAEAPFTVPDLETQQEGHALDGKVASIHVVSCAQVVRQ